MEPVSLTTDLWQLPFPVGHVYALRGPDGYTLVDTGLPGSAPAILHALATLGGAPEDLRQIVLTHSHIDHMGSAAVLVAATGARVLAGAADAPVIDGTSIEQPPCFSETERVLHERIMADVAPNGAREPQRLHVDRKLSGGDTLDGLNEPALVVHVPGHTEGSVALQLPGSNVLLTGDTIATVEGRAILGPFNVGPERAVASFHRLTALEPDVLCVGHGDPVVGGATALLRQAAPERDWR